MADVRPRHIAELLPVHAEDLAFLWGQRREALTSRRHTLREFNELNERIEAHLQGLLIAGPTGLKALMQPQLASPDRDEAFAAAYALLRVNDAEATRTVMVEFSRAAGPALGGVRDALSSVPLAAVDAEVRSALKHAKPLTAVAAAVVLANHHALEARSPRLALLLEDEDPAVCALAWRAATLTDAVARDAPVRRYRSALTHAAPLVRHAGWGAAAWSGQAQAMPALRHVASEGDTTALQWLAVLGDASDVSLLRRAAELGKPVAGSDLLARHGHPAALDTLLAWMDGTPAEAAAAGEAFTRITGIDIRGRRVTLPVAEDADEFAREMAPDVWLPDISQARSLMERHGTEWQSCGRWCRGLRLDGDVSRDVLAQLDLEARWDTAARAAIGGRSVSSPAPIH